MSEKQKVKVVELKSEDKYQRLLGGAPDTCGMKSGNVLLRPGEEVGEHSTEEKEEAILILSGEAEFFIENSASKLTRGITIAESMIGQTFVGDNVILFGDPTFHFTI